MKHYLQAFFIASPLFADLQIEGFSNSIEGARNILRPLLNNVINTNCCYYDDDDDYDYNYDCSYSYHYDDYYNYCYCCCYYYYYDDDDDDDDDFLVFFLCHSKSNTSSFGAILSLVRNPVLPSNPWGPWRGWLHCSLLWLGRPTSSRLGGADERTWGRRHGRRN